MIFLCCRSTLKTVLFHSSVCKLYKALLFSVLAINDPSTDDVKMDGLIDTIATGLFAVCVTLGVVPIIKCLRNNDAAEHVARVNFLNRF